MIRNSFASGNYQPNPAFRQNAAPHARMRKKVLSEIITKITESFYIEKTLKTAHKFST